MLPLLLLLAQSVAGQIFGYNLKAPRAALEEQAVYIAGDTVILCTEASCPDPAAEEASLIFRPDGSLKYGFFVPVEGFAAPKNWIFLKRTATKWCKNSELSTDGEFTIISCSVSDRLAYPFIVVISFP